MRRSLVISIFALSVFLSACGSEGPPSRNAPGDAAGPAADQPGDIRYSCGGAAFDPRKLEGPGDLEDSDSPLGEALRALLATPDGAMDREGWRILHETEDEVLTAAPSPDGGHPFVSATFKRAGEGWEPAGWGDCLPLADVGKRSIALWELDAPVDENATEVTISVNERACSSGRKLAEEEIQVDIDYREDSIVLLASADPLTGGGAYTCPGNPSTIITVQLDESVGGRELIDGGRYSPE